MRALPSKGGLQWRRGLIPAQPQLDVVIERDAEGFYVASEPQLPGCRTQARSLDDVTQRIREVEGAPEQDLEFVGIQRITIAA